MLSWLGSKGQHGGDHRQNERTLRCSLTPRGVEVFKKQKQKNLYQRDALRQLMQRKT